MTQQECDVSRWWCDLAGSGWGRNSLRICVGDRSERKGECENAKEKATKSHSLCRQMTKNDAHLFLQLFGGFQVELVGPSG
jgi:hypothetical protein